METIKPNLSVFVLMPFGSSFTDIYEVGIKAACREAGVYCERVDEQIFTESILERIYTEISKADIIIADMTGRNPNVFYEVGYAHALKKTVILLTQYVGDIPFDLQHFPHIVYEGKIALLKSKLESKIRWCVENSSGSLGNAEVNLEFIIDGVPLVNKPEVKLPIWKRMVHGEMILLGPNRPIKLAIHNLTNRMLRPDSVRLSLITPLEFDPRGIGIYTRSKLQDGRYMYHLEWSRQVPPDSWISIEVSCYLERVEQVDYPFEMILRLFTESAEIDYPFILKFLEAMSG